MEAAIANVTRPGARALVVVNGYFGDRLVADPGALRRRRSRALDVEWGRACDPDQVDARAEAQRADIVAVVHGETSTGVVNPVDEIVAIARQHGAITIVDAVTTVGGVPVQAAEWGADVCYSCTQKGLGAPSGLAPVTFSRAHHGGARPVAQLLPGLGLLEDYWVRRKYHHTLSAPLIYALHEALVVAEEEGLEARWARHRRHHLALAAGLEALGMSLLPPVRERLWTLNAVRVPEGVDEAAVQAATARRILD